ncbi:MAG TPA: acyltransferase [Bryobacteraceae bacterium]|nr:acyltransferase [Bryobacteraceae bacterium]
MVLSTRRSNRFCASASRIKLPNRDGKSRIPSLDGLRGFSIVLVLLAHAAGTQSAPAFLRFLERPGALALRVFFIQSGYLITSLLLSEWKKTGTVNLRLFYARRAYRILPAAYTYVLVAFIVFGPGLGYSHLLGALTYSINYDGSRPWPLGHLWSLAVEEQFYLLWPVILVLFFATRIRVLVGVIIATPIVNCLLLFMGWKSGVGNWFPTVADSLATGCLVAVLRPELDKVKILRSRWMIAVGAFVAVLGAVPISGRMAGALYTVIGLPVVHFGIAAFLYHAIHARYAILNFPLVVYLGTISYSLYLWQQPFLNRYSTSFFTAFPQNLVFSSLIGLVSYYAVERPVMVLRERRRDLHAVAQALTGASAEPMRASRQT